METFIGFDSAWAGNAKAPGAICAVTFSDDAQIRWYPPVLVGFDEALKFVADVIPTAESLDLCLAARVLQGAVCRQVRTFGSWYHIK